MEKQFLGGKWWEEMKVILILNFMKRGVIYLIRFNQYYIIVKMRYQSKPYRSLSFIQRENIPLRELRDKDNKENNNNLNLPNHQPHKNPIADALLPLKPSTRQSSSLSQPAQDIGLQLKKTYTELIAKDYSWDILSHISSSAEAQKEMLGNHNISASLRSKMVDWMIEVLSSYKMSEETFFRSVYLMDAYMKKCPQKLEVKDLHLIGVSSMFSAAKYEEIHPLKLSVIYEKIARKKFKKVDILDKESEIIKVLNFKLESPSVFDISRHIVEQSKLPLSDSSRKYFAKILLYLSKMALFNIELAEEKPLLLACGVVFIALKTLEQVDQSAQPQVRLTEVSQLMEVEEEAVLEVSRKVLDLAKNFSKCYPSLTNLKKFNKFEYGSD